MDHQPTTCNRVGRILLCAILVVGFACDGPDFSPTSFPSGALLITTETTGAVPDPDGYQLLVTGPSLDVGEEIGINDSRVFSVLAGDYQAALENVASNCTVDDNPRSLHVESRSTVQTTFELHCS